MRVLHRDEDDNLIVLMSRREWGSATATDGYPGVGDAAEIVDMPALQARLAKAAAAITDALAERAAK